MEQPGPQDLKDEEKFVMAICQNTLVACPDACIPEEDSSFDTAFKGIKDQTALLGKDDGHRRFHGEVTGPIDKVGGRVLEHRSWLLLDYQKG
jgi:hypothetical protein